MVFRYLAFGLHLHNEHNLPYKYVKVCFYIVCFNGNILGFKTDMIGFKLNL